MNIQSFESVSYSESTEALSTSGEPYPSPLRLKTSHTATNASAMTILLLINLLITYLAIALYVTTII